MVAPQLIPFKGIQLSKIDEKIDLSLAKMRKHYGTEVTGTHFDKLVDDFNFIFPNITKDTLYFSLMHLAGKQITREIVKETAWRIAGNIERLKDNIPISPWIQQTELEWCPIHIVRHQIGRGYDGNIGNFYEYRVLAGTPTSLKFTTFWSNKYTRFISREIGYTRTRKFHFKLLHPSYLVQMRLYLLFDPLLSKDERPIAFHFHVPSACKKYNRNIIQQRFRVISCPLEYKLSEMPCHKCPMGYDKCAAGCRPKTMLFKACPRCMQENWFDPLDTSVICYDCREDERRAK